MNTTGFPSPAQGYEKKTFDFNELLIRHPSSTFPMRYEGEDLPEFNILRGDILIVDSSLNPKNGTFAVVIFDNNFHCVYIQKDKSNQNSFYFIYKNKKIILRNIFGIITSVIRYYDYTC